MALPSGFLSILFKGKVNVTFLESINKGTENLQQEQLQFRSLVVSDNRNVVNNNS